MTWISPKDYDWQNASDTQIAMMARNGLPEAVAEYERRKALREESS